MRVRLFLPLVFLALVFSTLAAGAAELVMFRRDGCVWCAMWDREIAPIYGQTEVGRRIAARSVQLGRDNGVRLLLKSPIKFSPTFVLVDRSEEVGRIEGYPGADFFWGLLEALVRRLPQEQAFMLPAHRAESRAGQ
jgi:hypothetical protein